MTLGQRHKLSMDCNNFRQFCQKQQHTMILQNTIEITICNFAIKYLFSWDLLTVFLAAFHIFRPVTRMWPFVVEQTSDAELFGGGAVPASPIPGAWSLVSEYSVQPVTMFGWNGSIWENREANIRDASEIVQTKYHQYLLQIINTIFKCVKWLCGEFLNLEFSNQNILNYTM